MTRLTKTILVALILLSQAVFGLPVSADIISQYRTGRDTRLTENDMSVRCVVERFDSFNPGSVLAVGNFLNGTTALSEFGVQVNIQNVTTPAGLVAAAQSALQTYATAQGYGTVTFLWPSGLPDAPQPAISDLPTNLNPITTLLGALTGQVNDTNQTLNTLLAELRTLGLITS